MKFFVYFLALFLSFSGKLKSHDLYKSTSFYSLGSASFVDYKNPDSIFINPANLKYLDYETKFRLNAQLISSMGLNDYVTSFFGSDPSGKVTSEADLQKLANSNKFLKIASSISYIFSDSYAIIFEGLWTADTTFGQDSPIKIDMFSAYDISLGFVYNIELFTSSIAITPKFIYRSAISGILSAADLNDEGILPSLGSSNTGMAIGVDLGIIKKFSVTSYSLSFKNLGTGFILLKNTPTNLPSLPMSVSLSATTAYDISKYRISSFLALTKYLNYTESSLLNLFHVGLEFALSNTLFLRGGFMNTSYSFGIAVKYWLIEISVASFVEDSLMFANDTSLPWAKNRRYVLEMTMYF